MTDPEVQPSEIGVWRCSECGNVDYRLPYVPAADLAAAREEVERLREALRRVVEAHELGYLGLFDSRRIERINAARAALDTTGEA